MNVLPTGLSGLALLPAQDDARPSTSAARNTRCMSSAQPSWRVGGSETVERIAVVEVDPATSAHRMRAPEDRGHRPGDADVRLACADAQVIVIVNVFSAVVPRSSVTCTVKVNVPAVVGVPLIVFSRLGSSKPGGSTPDTTDQV
jgi:hypothetical protein